MNSKRICLSNRWAQRPPRACWGSLLSLLFAAFALSVCATPAHADKVTGQLKIYMLNIGQGDAILIVCPHKQPHYLLIDSGAKSYPKSQDAFRQLIQKLVPGSKPKLDVVVATHPHEDHIGGMLWVLQNFSVSMFVDNGRPYTSTFKSIRTEAQKQSKSQMPGSTKKLVYVNAATVPSTLVADFCPAGNVKSELLIPKGFGKASNVNNNSIAIRVTYDQMSFLFTGDAEKQEEALLLQDTSVASRLQNVIFYKAGHHGAETSTTSPLLQTMSPKWVGISSGAKNISKNTGYRHPRAKTLDGLLGVITQDAALELRTVDAGQSAKGQWTTKKIHKHIYVTTKDGTLLFVSDGETFSRQPVPAALPDPVGHH